MSGTIRLGLVGFGKIARDQHVLAIARTPGIELVAIASPGAAAEGLACYETVEAMLAGEPSLDAVVLCQPPRARYAAARCALLAGKHVFLEKPPGATLSEVEALIALARAKGLGLFAGWHSREAAAVVQAAEWLADKTISGVEISWKEDVRVWHPGQAWIWEPGGFGVFDPGINALSILTRILPEPVRMLASRLEVPADCATPIAADLQMETGAGVPITATFDFRQTGPQSWDVRVRTDEGELVLGEGGNTLTIDGVVQPQIPEQEYPALYRRFVELARNASIDVDLAPLRLVADAFMCGELVTTDPFNP